MSGSESSAPCGARATPAATPGEALHLSVFALDEPGAATQPRQTRAGRLKMLIVLLVCAAPVVASYLMYFVVRPEPRDNYGSLIHPPRAMPTASLRGLDGSPQTIGSLQRQWLLVVVAPSACNGPCEKLLHAQRQLREMLGRDRERIDKVWLISDDGLVRPPLVAALSAAPAATMLRIPPPALAAWLEPEAGRSIDEHLYLVDPLGRWMMRFPADFDPARVKRDLERLLRASASWDRAGR